MPKWSLNSDFSLIHNPSSVWSYGSKPAGYHVTANEYSHGLHATFTHIDTSASHTGVYIIYNNLITLWETGLAGPEDSKSFKTTDKGISVKADEPIDFIVGVGLDNVYYFDMTFTRVDIHLLDLLENQPGFPIITGSIGFVLGIIISAILFHIYYRYRENRRNANVGYQVIN
ncbi:hypothetical protein GLOIN_2v1715372 [Rhizophagus irregularis DAOM 181602=DAOM 197198]|nr:hypothetical protein GLOIN_2v1715372 [Rhizophagus irregularis DAOM 181602=DAOM 197198]